MKKTKKMEKYINQIVNKDEIIRVIERTKNPASEIVFEILQKAKEKKGLALEEVGILLNFDDSALTEELFKTAAQIKDEIYGGRLVFFAPLYISDFCVNNCDYCNFHVQNKKLERKKLFLEEVEEQTKFLINSGHKRILLECGEDYQNNTIDYVLKVIEKIYTVKTEKGNIRRINVNIAATTVENYRKLKEAKTGTYQLFQETYHKPTYEKIHHGPKADFERQISAHLKAFEAGIDDLGLGVLFGLYDWRFEVLALVAHAQYLEKTIGVGPHTISVPRFRPAPTVDFNPPYPVSDDDFLKLIAILRLAIPYTGMILSTRETPEIRKKAFEIGISQASAASVTSCGGYGKDNGAGQFKTADHRSLEEVIKSILDDKLLPSFCTACYRLGRTGEHFMELSKPGEIHNFCRPNGLLTFAEYLQDFAQDGLYEKGYEVINFYLNQIEDQKMKEEVVKRLKRIKNGDRDLYF
jgi:2-iminoacetate synthase